MFEAMSNRLKIPLFLAKCLALTGFFLIVFSDLAPDRHQAAIDLSMVAQPAYVTTSDDHCPADDESFGCSMICSTGTCGSHFANGETQTLIAPTAKTIPSNTSRHLNRILLVFDLLRPPRVTL